MRQHWNCIPHSVRELIIDVALERPDLSPRELAWHITDTNEYFISESSIYRFLKALDLITSPQFAVSGISVGLLASAIEPNQYLVLKVLLALTKAEVLPYVQSTTY